MLNIAQSITAVLISAVSSLYGGDAVDQSQFMDDAFVGQRVDYTCTDVKWSNNSGMQGNQFKGTVSVDCKFTAENGGGFTELNRYMIDELVHGKATLEVHQGPDSETYSKLPSTYLDLTVEEGHGSDVARIRQDAHIATDLATRLIFATISKKIQGNGFAAYIKKTDINAEIQATSRASKYTAAIQAYVVLERPWFVPAGTFENMVRDKIKQNAQKVENRIITEAAQHL